MTLPKQIIVDLFDIEYKPSRTAIDHISEVIENKKFIVEEVNNYDIRIWYNFTIAEHNNLKGQLIVDRMNRQFEISATNGDITYAGITTKDFGIIEEWLKLLSKDLG